MRPAFDKAADAVAARRKQQEAALTQEQRAAYQRVVFQQRERLREFSRAFDEREGDLIDEEKRRLLLHKPDLALRMLPGRPLKEHRARQLAFRMVHDRHALERLAIEREQQRERDYVLESAEAVRRMALNHDLSAAFQAKAAQKKDKGPERDGGRDRERE